jgi:phosphonate transport system ATP-binding protein
VLELLTVVQSHHHATLVMTLHQPELARRFAQRVIGLRAGRIAWDGPACDLTDEVLKTLYETDRRDIIPFADRASA